MKKILRSCKSIVVRNVHIVYFSIIYTNLHHTQKLSSHWSNDFASKPSTSVRSTTTNKYRPLLLGSSPLMILSDDKIPIS